MLRPLGRYPGKMHRNNHIPRLQITAQVVESLNHRIHHEWLDTPLGHLGLDPAKVAKKHDDVTSENGPHIANGSMRTLRAIYNHARKTSKSLPADNPVDAIDWNHEKRRDTGMGTGDLKAWFTELAALAACRTGVFSGVATSGI